MYIVLKRENDMYYPVLNEFGGMKLVLSNEIDKYNDKNKYKIIPID